MLGAIVLSVVLGLAVAAGTSLLLSSEKAAQLPGGSLSVGLITGYTLTHEVGTALLCAVAGVLGWVIYRLIVKK